jgi:hypothetical protein
VAHLEALDTLSVSRAIAGQVSAVDGRLLARELGQLLRGRPSIKSLFVCGLSPVVIVPLLRVLATNVSLLELDVSSNRLTDTSASVLSLFLRTNVTLVALAFDDNMFELPAFLSLKAALDGCISSALRFMQFPWIDYERLRDKTDVRAVLLSIRDMITLRRGGGAVSERFTRYLPEGEIVLTAAVPAHVRWVPMPLQKSVAHPVDTTTRLELEPQPVYNFEAQVEAEAGTLEPFPVLQHATEAHATDEEMLSALRLYQKRKLIRVRSARSSLYFFLTWGWRAGQCVRLHAESWRTATNSSRGRRANHCNRGLYVALS